MMQELSDKIHALSPYENRFKNLTESLNAAHRVGEVLEFGVFSGGTINHMARCEPETVFWGFDSFKGLPEDWVRFPGDRQRPRGFYASGMPAVKGNVRLIRGWFKDTLPQWMSENDSDIRMLHIDCDLYSSTSQVLTLLNQRIKQGTVLVFDELMEFEEASFQYENWRDGEWKALQEWMINYDRDVTPISRDNTCRVTFMVENNPG